MYNVQNSDTTKEMRDAIRASVSEGFPNKVLDTIQPVININPKDYRRSNFLGTSNLVNGTSGTLATVDSSKPTFITSAQIALIKDATATTTNVSVRVTPKGQAAKDILIIPSLTLTAHTEAISTTFEPMELEPGSTIRVVSATGVANVSVSATVQGYVIEP